MPESAEITRAAEGGLMRPRVVADYLAVSRQRVDQLADLGRLPEPRLVAGPPHVAACHDRKLG